MKKLLVIFSVLLLFTGCGSEETKNVEPSNSDETSSMVSVYDDANVESVIVTDMNVAYYDNISHIAFSISNENGNSVTYNELTITYYTEDDVLVSVMKTNVGTIEGSSKKEFFLQTDVDLTDTTKVEYSLS